MPASPSVRNAVARAEEPATMRDLVKRSESQFALALPRHVDSKRFLRAALTALNTIPKLMECTEQSVLAGLMQAAQLGLEVSDVRGQAYLIPRWDGRDKVNKASFQLGYRGMIDLAARAGITVDVDTIREHDRYEYQRGTDPKLTHVPTLADRGDSVAYYAVGHFADGRRPAFVLMGKSEMENHRDKFAQRNKDGKITGPWVDHFDAMARKTVIRQLLNYLPTSAELRTNGGQVTLTEVIDTDIVDGPTLASYERPANVDTNGEIHDIDPTAAIPATATDTGNGSEQASEQ